MEPGTAPLDKQSQRRLPSELGTWMVGSMRGSARAGGKHELVKSLLRVVGQLMVKLA